jgi:hypothetical protein
MHAATYGVESSHDFVGLSCGTASTKGFAVDKDPLRRMNDLDVLIDEKDFERVFIVLERAGYRYTGSSILR